MRGIARWTAETATAAAISVGLVVAWVVDASPWLTGSGWQWRTGLCLLLAATWWLAWRQRIPRWVLVLLVVAVVSYLNIDRLNDHRAGGPSLVLTLLVVFWVALTGGRTEALAATVGGLITALTFLWGNEWASIAGLSLVTVLAYATGRAYAGQRAAYSALEEAQRALAQRAAVDERRRIAKEIHDIAAHSLAITMLHLTGTRLRARRLGLDDDFQDALAAAEEAGRASIGELRQVVGLLRDHDSNTLGPLDPATPTAAEVPDLVNAYAEAGLPVHLEMHGEPTSLDPLLGLTVYRVTQEALANVVRHAGAARTSVELEIGSRVRLSIQDCGGQRPAKAGSGRGIAGMRERVVHAGGVFSAGPHGPGWRVSAVFDGGA